MPPVTALKKGAEQAVGAVEKGVEAPESKNLFAKEMQYQVYRMENVLKLKDTKNLRSFVKENSEWYQKPMLMNFLDSYEGKKTNEFIEKAKESSAQERERLLDGIRGVIYKAKKEKFVAEKGPAKAQQEKDKEEERLKGLIEKELSDNELTDIESSMYESLNFPKDKMDFKKVQQYYLKILTGQKALAVHAVNMQQKYNESMKKVQGYYKKYESGWRHYAGIADWGWRSAKNNYGKAKEVLGWLGSKIPFVGKKISKPKPKPPSEEDKINELVKKAAQHFENNMARVKNLQKNLLNRSNELKIGLGTFKGNLREKLKELIARGDWTKAKQMEREMLKETLKKQKEALEESFKKARNQGDEIDKAKQGTGRLSEDLKKKYAAVEGGETNLNKRIQGVLARIKQLETYYGTNDPRVRHMRENVLLPLTQSREKINTAKENTKAQLTDTDKKNQKLDILKADTYIAQTASIEQISKLNLQITSEGRKIDVLKNTRFELHKSLEGMEFAYAAVDEFKDNLGKNLDKMNANNDKTVDALGKQMAGLKKTQVRPPGFGSSLYNTVGIGKWGVYGAAIELPFKYAPRTIGYAVGYLGAKLFGSDVKWKDTEKWNLPGLIEYATGEYDKWLNKGAFKQYLSKNSSGFWKSTAGTFNFTAGAFGMVTGVIRGANAIIFETPKVLDSIELMATDWKYTKEALKGVINYHHLEKGQYGIWAGKTTADIVLLVLTAGSSSAATAGSKAAEAAALSGKVSKFARAFAYTKGFVGEVGRKFAAAPGRAAGRLSEMSEAYFSKFPKGVIGKTGAIVWLPISPVYRVGKFGVDVLRGIVRGKGLQYVYETKLSRIVGTGRSVANPAEFSKLERLREKVFKTAGLDKYQTRDMIEIIDNSNIKNLFERLKNRDELINLSSEELGILHQGLGELMYKPGTGLFARTHLETLRNSLGRYLNGRVKAEALEQTLNFRRAHVELLEQQPSTLRGIYELKGQIEQRIIEYNDKIAKLEARIKKMDPARTKLIAHGRSKIEQLKADKLALSAKYKQLSYGEILKGKHTQILTAAKDKVSDFIQTLKGKSKAQAAFEVGKFVTMPVWMPYKYAGRIIKHYYELYTKPDAAKATKALEDALAQKGAPKLGSTAEAQVNLKAFSDSSMLINSLLKKGMIREAVKLYQSARIYGNSLKPPVPFAALDRSFLGHLHRVAPATVNYISKNLDLTDPDTINGLPERITINTNEWKKMTAEHASMLARMSENVKIGGSFVKHENAKEPEKSKLRKAYDTTKSTAIRAGRTISRGAERAYEKSKATANKILASISLPGWMSVKTAKDTAGYIAEKAKQVAGKVKETISPQTEINLSGATTASLEALSQANKAVDKSIEEGNLRKAIEKYHEARLLGAQLTGKAQMALDWDRSFLEYIHKVVPESKKHIKDISDLRRLDKISQLPEKLGVDRAAYTQAKARLDADVKKLSNTYLKQ